jgi:UDP-glucose 4-epimerase
MNTLNNVIADTGHRLSYEILPERSFDVMTNILNSEKLTKLTCWRPKTSFYDGLYKTWSWVITEKMK